MNAMSDGKAIEIQDIFRQYGGMYQQKHTLPTNILKAMTSIECCRTSVLGGHSIVCDDCGNIQISYNPCRNRHCPKCQSLSKERWIDSQKQNLLNVEYFHVVFTIPDKLNTLVFQNQKLVYSILFQAVAQTLSELCADKKYLGAKIGHTSVLHTWGQNLMHHPHIHCIVPGGGIDNLGRWQSSRKKFFIPVKVLSRKFRGKFLHMLQRAYDDAKLEFFSDQKYLENLHQWNRFLTTLYDKEWVVYCKPPFKSAGAVVEYLGRYTHRVAISNNRIVNVENDQVRFKWRDYKDENKWKVMALAADEFIRRFLIHILPHGFMKIRHYGLLGNRGKKARISLCKKLTNTKIQTHTKLSTPELIFKITGKDTSICVACGSKNIRRKELQRAPPIIQETA